VIFFHPLAWLARRRLRWERELVCDESVAQGSEESRLEYASCLTTLASWWFLEKEAAGQVDFLSSPPSLLAVRVRSILTQQPTYGSCKKAVLTLLAATAVSAQVVLVPEIGISSYPSLPLKVASQQSPLSLERAHAHRKHAIRRRNQLASFALAPMMQSWSSAPNFNFPVRLPVLSPSPTEQGHPSESGSMESSSLASASTESSNNSQSAGTIWDESRPQTVRRRASKIGAVALRMIKVGVGIAVSQIGDHEHEHEKEP